MTEAMNIREARAGSEYDALEEAADELLAREACSTWTSRR